MDSDLERLRELNATLIEDSVNQRVIIYLILDGHTHHCAQRMAFGYGGCECGRVRQGCDTISVSLLKSENERLRTALHDAIGSMMGVVPDSAVGFYEPDKYYGE